MHYSINRYQCINAMVQETACRTPLVMDVLSAAGAALPPPDLLRWVTIKLCTSKWLSSELFFDFLQSRFYISWPNWVFFLFKLWAKNCFLIGFQACWPNCYLCDVMLSDKQELMLQWNPYEEQIIVRVSVFLCRSRKASLTVLFLFIHAFCSFVVKLKQSHFSAC